MIDYAVRTTAPPFSLIFFSAIFEISFALTTTGWFSGSTPLPKTLKQPYWVTSINGTLSLEALSFASWGTKDQSLSMLTIGQQNLLRSLWKYLIPTLPKYPGWYLSNRIRWWCMPPAFPRPPGCFLCFPILPCPALTCPRFFRCFLNRVVISLFSRVSAAKRRWSWGEIGEFQGIYVVVGARMMDYPGLRFYPQALGIRLSIGYAQ